ncbi:MAG: class B sortase, partial [Lachnospiraceae bacterium]|nr:class B sortase [Lachnospiraceae bacterium]
SGYDGGSGYGGGDGGYGNSYGGGNGAYGNSYGAGSSGYDGGSGYGGGDGGYGNGYSTGNSGYGNGYGAYGNGYNGGNGGHPGTPNNGSDKNRKPRKKRSKVGDVLSIIVMVVAFGVFVFAGYKLYGYYREYKKADDEYANLATYTTGESETEDLEALEDAYESEGPQSISGREVEAVELDGEVVNLPTMVNPIDFESLKEVNSDIVGWLKIRALDLSYPVVQGEDNDYYLHRSFEQEYLFAGCLFVHYENNSDFTDQNTIIYGHNMKNGSMFGSLKQLRNEEVYNKSKYFWIFTETVIYQYRIFSARVVDKVGQTYQIVFSDEEEYQEFLDTAMENSEVDNSTVSVTTDDKVVTLSTCTGDSATRFVVQGKLVQMYAAK